MREIDIVVMESDDWDALYVDGTLDYEGHEDLMRVVLSTVVGRYVRATRRGYAEYDTPAGKYLEEHGGYPLTVAELEALGETFD